MCRFGETRIQTESNGNETEKAWGIIIKPCKLDGRHTLRTKITSKYTFSCHRIRLSLLVILMWIRMTRWQCHRLFHWTSLETKRILILTQVELYELSVSTIMTGRESLTGFPWFHVGSYNGITTFGPFSILCVQTAGQLKCESCGKHSRGHRAQARREIIRQTLFPSASCELWIWCMRQHDLPSP